MSASQYEAAKDSRESAHRNAVSRLASVREQVKNFLMRAEYIGAPAFKCVANPQPPRPTDIQGGLDELPDWVQAINALHAATLSYWSEVRPYRAHATELWQEPLIKFNYPIESKSWERTLGKYKETILVKGTQSQGTELTLSHLQYWRFKQVNLYCKPHRKSGGSPPKSRTEKVFLPRAACSVVIDQLDDILSELGMLAEIRQEREVDAEPW